MMHVPCKSKASFHSLPSYRSSSKSVRPTLRPSSVQLPPLRERPYPRYSRPLDTKPNQQRRRWGETTRGRCTPVDVLRLMDALGLSVHSDIYASLLNECTVSRDANSTAELHAHIERSGLRVGMNLANRLLLALVACGRMDCARQVFEGMPIRDFISWTTLIAGHSHHGDPFYNEEALRLFVKMLHGSVAPVIITAGGFVMVNVLRACISLDRFEFGEQVHGWALKLGFATGNLYVGCSLIDFYGRFQCMASSKRVFDDIRSGCRDTVVWTAMLAALCRGACFLDAVEVFKEMGRAGKRMNSFTFSSVLRACGWVGDDARSGRQVHCTAIKVGFESDEFVRSSLLGMYGRCGLVGDARKAFEGLGQRDASCWNAMLSFYARLQHGCCVEAIQFLYEMKAAGVEPQESLLNDIRLACVNVEAIPPTLEKQLQIIHKSFNNHAHEVKIHRDFF